LADTIPAYNVIPYGYDVVIEGDGDKTVKVLVPNKAEQKAIKLIGQLRTKGHSLRAIGRELERRGISTKRGKAKWHPQTVQTALSKTMSRGGLKCTSAGRVKLYHLLCIFYSS